MARYRIKRKTKSFGVVDAAGNALGNAAGGLMEGVGKAADTKAGNIAGGILGAKLLGPAIGSMTGFGSLGTIGGYVAGKAITHGAAKGLKQAGQDLQNN